MPDFEQRRRLMVDTQIRPSDVTKFPIIDAMLTVPREQFVPGSLREAAYAEQALPIGPGRVMLEPRTLAKMLDALDIQPTELVLDIGCGLGYSAALIARLAEAVVAVEPLEGLAEEGQGLLSDAGIDNAVILERELAHGAPKHGPYDVITLQGAVEALPAGLIDQLKEGGRIGCIFAEGAVGALKVGTKIGGRLSWHFVANVGAPVLPGFEREEHFAL
ncbi:Protein-L-isoaspartate O-methyltransferase [Pseudoruegeria aquimaris]|uniref:Protein-L-isoaspartate O-methyltransferase n=1 Tax=Pseudoruegeria aquimaris TaxID=393663 RepID=A0A1Y5TAI3_9RHOB|nr:protein-L-isoaspartate O-methyltransferase [Pseudoruegeria aquimaris]SLN57547.1 Protein-L-isoaspartate O-methyltransferase [Pseudoruegeria aquimaris]